MIRTSSILFWFSLIIIASLGLYRTSNRVQQYEQQLETINASIDGEKQSLHVLNAEWVYLTNPARIEAAAHKHLALRATTPQQVASMDTLPEVLPTRSEAMSTVAVNAAPMATVRTTLASRIAAPQPVAVTHGSKAKMVTIASADDGHLRDHMILVQRTASAAPLPGDSIGALLNDLNGEH